MHAGSQIANPASSELQVHICGPRDLRNERYRNAISTVSNAPKDWRRGLSPFILGPVQLYGNFVSQTMENGWQYCKVYPEHADVQGNPTREYWTWAHRGWRNTFAARYPMGKGRKPLYAIWQGEHLQYIDARKQIYAPLYARAVVKTEAFARLRAIAQQRGEITLFDFDGYDHEAVNMTLDEVLNSDRIMGHAFVLKMLLTAHPFTTALQLDGPA